MRAVREPEVVEGDDHRRRHMMWAMWGEDAKGVDAHLGYWCTRDGRIVLQSIQANADIRGRAMLRWLTRYGLPIHVVEVIPQAVGFWRRMHAERLIAYWEPATGRASRLERAAVPFPQGMLAT